MRAPSRLSFDRVIGIRMSHRLNIRFQHWVLGSTFLVVSVLSAAVLLTVFQTFRQMAEDGASGRFSLIANRAWSELDGMIGQNTRFTVAQADAEPALFVTPGGRLNTRDMVPLFIGSLSAHPSTYSHFFGLPNEEFLQVIGVRGQPGVAAALGAPAGTEYAVRRILLEGGGRGESWEFLDRRRKLLGEARRPVTFVPTERPWFAETMQQDGLVITAPYLFASSGAPGVTVAAPLPGRIGVLGTDVSLEALQTLVETLPLPDNGAIAVFDADDQLLAFEGRGKYFGHLRILPLERIGSIGSPYLRPMHERAGSNESSIVELGAEREQFVLTRFESGPPDGRRFGVVVLAPLSDFLGPFAQAKDNVIVVTVLIMLVFAPLSWIGSRQVVNALTVLAADSERLKRMDFSRKPHPPETFLYEVNALGEAQCVMQEAIEQRTRQRDRAQLKLARLVDNGIRLSRQQDRDALLRHILFGAREIANCAAATLYLKTERNTLMLAHRTQEDSLPVAEIPLYDEAGQPNESFLAAHVALHGESVAIDDVHAETRFDLTGTRSFNEASGFRTVSMLAVPLSPRAGEVSGVIQLLDALDPDTGEAIPFAPDIVGFVDALAAQSAVALENRNLVDVQRELMDALIKLLAGAIDAKSAYTGGHCERVPELALMLARAAEDTTHGPLADFRFRSEDERREFRIGAWLHDCGKVTTPEYVVDKATKLETLYNRIHEIRTRFEVLLRDARIEQLEAVHLRGEDAAVAGARFEACRAQLIEDFAFIATANIGGESMAPEHIERVRRIGARVWLRHFDDRLGLSQDELRRRAAHPAPALPVPEPLLADQPWHAVPRETHSRAYDASHGWKLRIPEKLYDFGEVYNLTIARGTLTDEERFKINEHIMQTILMLESLPLPGNLRRVPEYAGTHHETMIGTGYPRGLTAEQLSVPSRIMAVADIFEALTASDRPYKPMKTLSEAIRILHGFKRRQHIDPAVFDLFLTSGVYLEYARRFLRPEQIDEVDITPYLG